MGAPPRLTCKGPSSFFGMAFSPCSATLLLGVGGRGERQKDAKLLSSLHGPSTGRQDPQACVWKRGEEGGNEIAPKGEGWGECQDASCPKHIAKSMQTRLGKTYCRPWAVRETPTFPRHPDSAAETLTFRGTIILVAKVRCKLANLSWKQVACPSRPPPHPACQPMTFTRDPLAILCTRPTMGTLPSTHEPGPHTNSRGFQTSLDKTISQPWEGKMRPPHLLQSLWMPGRGAKSHNLRSPHSQAVLPMDTPPHRAVPTHRLANLALISSISPPPPGALGGAPPPGAGFAPSSCRSGKTRG